ncbi:MAG: hypothetical protein ACREVN_04675 [Gammaproteobacteria bacterium]
MWKSWRVPVLAACLLVTGASLLPVARAVAQDDKLESPPAPTAAETHERVQRLLEQGDAELEFGLINGALFYYDQAWQLDERYPGVSERLRKVADLMIENAPRADDEDGLEVYLRDIDNLMARGALKSYDGLIEQRMAAQQAFAGLGKPPNERGLSPRAVSDFTSQGIEE